MDSKKLKTPAKNTTTVAMITQTENEGSSSLFFLNATSSDNGVDKNQKPRATSISYLSASTSTFQPNPNNIRQPRAVNSGSLGSSWSPGKRPVTVPGPTVRPGTLGHKTSLIPDTQEVGSDTSDLLAYSRAPAFLLNFDNYGENIPELCMHIGLRSRNGSTSTPTPTDDYGSEVLRFLRRQNALERLKIILEVSPQDSCDELKAYVDVTSSALAYPLISPSPYLTRGPRGLTEVWIEMPGLSANQLPTWKSLLEEQSLLRILICNLGSVHWSFYAKIIEKNSPSLERVTLRRVKSYDFNTREQIPLDFGIFEKCEQLSYLKITGGRCCNGLGICGGRGCGDTWAEWISYGHPKKPEQIFLHVNLEKLNTSRLKQFHWNKYKLEVSTLEILIANQKSNEGKVQLEVLCPDCPDKEYYEGDLDSFGLRDLRFGDAIIDIELAMILTEGINSTRSLKSGNFHRRHQKDRSAMMCLFLVLFCVGFFSITIVVCVAIYFSHPNAN